MLEEINAAVDAWASRTRLPDGRRYIEMLEVGLSRHISAVGDVQPGALAIDEVEPLARSLARYHASDWRHEGTRSIVMNETAGSRERYTFPNIQGFCASARVKLPERRSHTQFLSDFNDTAAFRRRFAAAFCAFDHVLIEDPLPWCSGWQAAGWHRAAPRGVEPPGGFVVSDLNPAERHRIAAWLRFCRLRQTKCTDW